MDWKEFVKENNVARVSDITNTSKQMELIKQVIIRRNLK